MKISQSLQTSISPISYTLINACNILLKVNLCSVFHAFQKSLPQNVLPAHHSYTVFSFPLVGAFFCRCIPCSSAWDVSNCSKLRKPQKSTRESSSSIKSDLICQISALDITIPGKTDYTKYRYNCPKFH